MSETNGHTLNGKPQDAAPSLPPSSDDGAPGRTARGAFAKGNKLGRRFARGNKAGCGNPYTRRVGELRAAFLDAVTPDNIQSLAHALLAKALDGDLPAAQLFLSYAVGKPGDAINPDDADLDEWARTARRPSYMEIADVASRRAPGIAAEAARTCWTDSPQLLKSQIREERKQDRARRQASNALEELRTAVNLARDPRTTGKALAFLENVKAAVVKLGWARPEDIPADFSKAVAMLDRLFIARQ